MAVDISMRCLHKRHIRARSSRPDIV